MASSAVVVVESNQHPNNRKKTDTSCSDCCQEEVEEKDVPTYFERFVSENTRVEAVRLSVLVADPQHQHTMRVKQYLDLKPEDRILAAAFAPYGELGCPNAPFSMHVATRMDPTGKQVYVGSGEHPCRMLVLAGDEEEEDNDEKASFPRFHTLRAPPRYNHDAQMLTQYTIKGLSLARFESEVFGGAHNAKAACWVTDLEIIYDRHDRATSVGLMLHYMNPSIEYFYELEPDVAVPRTACMSVAMLFHAIRELY
jgi:hypothetical protein